MDYKFMSLGEVKHHTNLSKTTIYKMISDEIFPPQVKLGKKSVWLESEIEEIMKAYMAGADSSALREIVSKLMAARQGG